MKPGRITSIRACSATDFKGLKGFGSRAEIFAPPAF